MSRRNCNGVGTALLILALGGAALAAEERPRDWANYKGSPGRVVTWSDPTVKPPYKLKWVFWGEDSGTKDGILGVDGVILFANVGRFGGGNIYGVDARTGKVKWQYNCGGIWGRPAVQDGVVYVATMGANITAIDAKTGKAKWDVHTQAGPFWASPVVYEKSLFIGSIDKNLKRLYVMDTQTGHWRWIADAGGPSEPTVCVSDNVVYFWGWWAGVQALDMSKMLPEVRNTSVPPCRDGWIKGTHPGSLALGYRRAKDGRKLKVSQQYHRVLGKRGMGGNVVYNKLIKWRAATGKVRAGLVLAGGYLWAASQGIQQGKGRILAIDIKTGGIAWTGQLDGECWSTPAPAGGRVVVGCDDGKVYCFGR